MSWYFLTFPNKKAYKIIIYIIYKPVIWLLLQFNWLVATWCKIWVWGFSKQITNSFTCVSICVCRYMCLYMYVHVSVDICYMYVCMCMCVCVYIYVYIYIYILLLLLLLLFNLTIQLILCSTFPGIFSVRFSLDDIY